MAAVKKGKARSDQLIDPEDFITEEDLLFEDYLEELGPANPTVSIFRVLRDGNREQIGKVLLSEMIGDVYGWLRENCGTGKFQLYFRGEDKRYRGAKTVAVGELKTANGAQPAGNGLHPNAHQDFLEKQFALQQTFITGILGAMKGPDVGSLLSGLAQLAPKPAPAPDPTAMFANVVAAFATLRGPAKDEDWLTRAKTIIELAKDLQPDSGQDNVYSLLRDVGKEVVHRLGPGEKTAQVTTTTTNTPVLRVAPAPAGNGGGAAAALSAPVVSPVVSPVPSTPNGNGLEVQIPQNAADWLRVGLGYLKQKAQLFKDPGIYVDLILDNTEEPQWAAIEGSIREGATFEQLLTFDAEISQNEGLRNWFARLYDGLHAELFPPVDTARPGGNKDNANGDARSGAPG